MIGGKAMKHWRMKRTIGAEGRFGTGEWELSPWWSSYLPFIYKSRKFLFPYRRYELPLTPYRTRKNGKDVVSPCWTAEVWNGWLPTIWNALNHIIREAKYKIKALRDNPEDIPF